MLPRLMNTRLAAAALGLLVASALVGCQSNSSDSSTKDVDQAALDAAKAAVKSGSEKVTSGVPSSSPPAAKNKSLVLIPCSQAGEGCAQPTSAAKKAAQALGWSVKIIDGKGTADGASAAIRQAITLKPDGIITFTIDPSTVKSAVSEARTAGIKMVASSSPPTDLVGFADNPTSEAWKTTGKLGADYVIAKTGGKAKAVLITGNEFAAVTQRTDAFAKEIKQCDSCELVVTANTTLADQGTSLPRLVQQIAQKHPDMNAIFAPYDSATPAVLQGLKAVGADDVLVVSGDATSQALKCIREDCGEDATVAFALDWIGWADVDAMNRLFQGEDPKPAAENVPVKLITAKNVPSKPGTWDGDIDFEKEYLKMWNVE